MKVEKPQQGRDLSDPAYLEKWSNSTPLSLIRSEPPGPSPRPGSDEIIKPLLHGGIRVEGGRTVRTPVGLCNTLVGLAHRSESGRIPVVILREDPFGRIPVRKPHTKNCLQEVHADTGQQHRDARVFGIAQKMLQAFEADHIWIAHPLKPQDDGLGALTSGTEVQMGQIDFFFYTPDQVPLARAGNIRAFGVTSDARLPQAPEIPTVGEMGLPSVSFSAWVALFAPKNVPKDIIGTLNAAVVEALADPAVRSRLADFGFEVYPHERQTPEALGAVVKADAEKWWPLIKEFGIKPQ
jgi:Tripartite tricarboxylate transporter family receptor